MNNSKNQTFKKVNKTSSLNKVATVLLSTGIGILFCFCLSFRVNSPKVACIDIVRVLANAKQLADFKKVWDAEEKEITLKGDTIELELQKEMQNFEKNIASKKEADKMEFNRILSVKQSQYAKYHKMNMRRISDKKVAATKRILEKINELAKKYAIKNNYKMIIGATGNGNVVYLDESYDITNEIIKLINND